MLKERSGWLVSVGSVWALGTKGGGDQLEVTGLCAWLPSGLSYVMMEEREGFTMQQSLSSLFLQSAVESSCPSL